ncbi:MAG TPA: Coenzyme F420 hydrogenase/dehydrogenase, beta subunit C-terminal domain [Microbacterium sp.]|nr:Coenzyme F420 hydrogenase/dehydrogenase, beta subunit C-terminal domain [Microbacterium sp.]
MSGVRALVDDVIARDACSGCGLCTHLDRSLQMTYDKDGYLRPVPSRQPDEIDGAERAFSRSCPGVVVQAPRNPGSRRHELLGDYLESWEAWAVDEEVRHAGSSGGALTAINIWLLATGRSAQIVGGGKDAAQPRRSTPVKILTRDQALGAAGSRYAPLATLSHPDALTSSAVTAKPCEASALRAVSADDDSAPLILSFFCAGTPSQNATDTLLSSLGVPEQTVVDDLWYRGRGWPGRFTAIVGEDKVEAEYESSWGSTLGPTTQWRCKVCVDGVGESADIVSADSWVTDERGYPQFDEGAGVSALIARTPRGRRIVQEAIAEGVIAVRPLDMSQLSDAQPLQTNRRRFLLARLLGSRLAGRRPPRYSGFRFVALGLRDPRTFVRVLRGTRRRVREAMRRS